VDRARIRIVAVTSRERTRAIDALRAFAREIAAMSPPADMEFIEPRCEPDQVATE
jgi:hypothetical protein